MKKIDQDVYNVGMGTLIDVSDEITFKENPTPGAINIPYQKLLLNYKSLLEKNRNYYIICKKGIHSRKVVSILEFYGYNVTQVTRKEETML